MTRTKKIETTIISTGEADQILKEIALLDNRKMEVDSWATEEEQKIKERAKQMLILNKKTGETVDERRSALAANLLAFIERRKDIFEGKKRSIELTHGTIGFRLGTPKVETVGRINQKAIMTTQALLTKLKHWGWIEEKPRLDKQAILSSYAADKEKTLKNLQKVSLTVTQDDEPWLEPKRVEISAMRNRSEMNVMSKTG